jgi:hypothetical protein
MCTRCSSEQARGLALTTLLDPGEDMIKEGPSFVFSFDRDACHIPAIILIHVLVKKLGELSIPKARDGTKERKRSKES